MLVLAITIIGIPLVLLVVGAAVILGYASIALIVYAKPPSGFGLFVRTILTVSRQI